MKYSIVVHGGAGEWDGNSEEKKQKLLIACEIGEKMLKNGAKAIDVVEKVVNYLEDEPIFNAGRGSTLTINEDVEMDASIMIGDEEMYNRCGAVANLKNILHPISVARKVMEETPHILLVGEGANQFANIMGFEETYDLKTIKRINERKELLEELKRGEKSIHSKLKKLVDKHPELLSGTVGTVVFDGKRIVAGTSTGGIPLKLFGRVGDSALIGSGTYATNTCGVSCTGTGEIAIEFAIAKELCSSFKHTNNLEESAQKLIDEIKNKFPHKGTAFISLNNQGSIICKSIKEFGFTYATQDETTSFKKIKS